VRTTRSGLVVGVDVTRLDENAFGTWRVEFSANGWTYFVAAATDPFQDLTFRPAVSYSAGISGTSPRAVTGTFDVATSHVEVVAPFAALQGLSRKATVRDVTATGSGRYVNVLGTELRADDSAARPAPMRLAAC
jgi:hypothetical protein